MSSSSKRDLSDFLNPILIKELRQSARSPSFFLVFVLYHVALFFYVGVGLTGADQGPSADLSMQFWVFTGLFFLGVLPLMGMNAIANELAESRLELLHLTRLQSRGIVYGKWLSLLGQAFLVLCSLLPYITIRFFVGDVDILTDFLLLALIAVGSACLCCFAVFLSVFKSRIVRFGIALLGFLFVPGIIEELVRPIFYMGSFGFGLPGSSFISQIVAFVAIALLFLAVLCLLALEMAASKIAHPAFNHSTRKRLLVLASFAVLGLGFLVLDNISPTFFTLGVTGIVLLVGVGLINEKIPDYPSTLVPFTGKRAFLAPILAPGWPSGIRFLALCLTLLCWAWFEARPNNLVPLPLFLAFFFLLFGAMLLPRFVVLQFFGDTDRKLSLYILLSFLFLAIAMLFHLTGALPQFANTHLEILGSPIPHSGLYFFLDSVDKYHGAGYLMRPGSVAFPVVGSLTTLIVVILLAVRSHAVAPQIASLKERAQKIARNR